MSRILVLGNATLDVIQHVARLPEPGETLLSDLPLRCAGGKGLNQAVVAARTGAAVTLVAPVGRDPDGAAMSRLLAGEKGLHISWLMRDLPTDMSSIWVAGDGENTIVSSAGCAGSVNPEEAAAACAALRPGDLLLMQGNLPAGATRAAAEAARRSGATVMVNTAPIAWDMASMLNLVDIVIANSVEAQELTGMAGNGAALALRGSVGRAAIVTLGSSGALVVEEAGEMLIPAPRVNAVDASGAGDVMVGTLAGLFAQGRSLRDAAAIAVAAASLSVTRAGTTTSFPDPAELRDLASMPVEPGSGGR